MALSPCASRVCATARPPPSDPDRIRFTPSILPPYARRSKSLEMLIPILYLKGISTGDFEEALAALLGKDAPGLSASTIARLKEVWIDEHTRWQKRDLSAKRYVYVWADGIHLQARLEDDEAMHPGHHRRDAGGQEGTGRLHRRRARERAGLARPAARPEAAWLVVPPELAVADGALGFWKALGEVWPKTREQRCWVHKTANVLNKLPKSQQPKAKRALQEIWMAETAAAAETAFDVFIETYAVKYEKAAECLRKDREALLAFYDFPAEHWKHLRTTNPIESTFATVRHRTIRSKGCLSNKTALAMVFKLIEGAQKSWRRLDGHNHLPKIIEGVKFIDGLEVAAKPADTQPKPPPPDPSGRHQNSAIAPQWGLQSISCTLLATAILDFCRTSILQVLWRNAQQEGSQSSQSGERGFTPVIRTAHGHATDPGSGML